MECDAPEDDDRDYYDYYDSLDDDIDDDFDCHLDRHGLCDKAGSEECD